MSTAIEKPVLSRRIPAIVLGSLFAIAVATALTLSIRDKSSADQIRETQATLSRLEIRMQEIRALEWLAIAAREITPESEARLEGAKHDLVSTSNLFREKNQDFLASACALYKCTQALDATRIRKS